MMATNSNNQGLLSSWKEIASYLDCDERTCRRYELNFGLPIHRMEGTSKSRVYAYKEELDSWRSERLNGILNQNGKELAVPKPHKTHIYKRLLWLLPLLAVIIGAAIFLVRPSPGQPADFRIQGSRLLIIDEKGKELWDFDTGLQNLWPESRYRNFFQIKRLNESGAQLLPLLVIRDINQDGKVELLFAPKTESEWYEPGVYCLDSKGGQLWHYRPGHELMFGKHLYSADYKIHGIMTFDANDDGIYEIFLITAHQPHSPSGLVALDCRGKVQGEFVNWGRIHDIVCADFNGDGPKEILIAGQNDEYKHGVVALFDPGRISGSSPQGEVYACESCGPGSEKYYLLIPRTDVDLALKQDKVSIEEMHFLKNNRIELFSHIPQIYFELDYGLRVQDVKGSDTFRNQHRELKAAGKITSTLDDAYYEALKKGVLYWDGTEWTSTPTMNRKWNNPR
jgi:hypothetical protein